MSKVRINQGRAFMLHLRIGGLVFVMFMIAISFQYLPELLAIASAIAVSLIVPALWASFEVLEIDTNTCVISEYMLMMGQKFQESRTAYKDIDKIFINLNQMSQNTHSLTGKVHESKTREYHAYLKTTDQKKFFLISDSSIDKLMERLQPIVKKINTEVVKNL